ncbi:MAG: RluA family pseudouridine synthase [Comamonadaceae bacterium]|nr:MAG: RluA family pseudouridine synthase [Comamonadaceae bacterium]
MTESGKSQLIISGALAQTLPEDVHDEAEAGLEEELREASVPPANHGDRLDRTLAAVVPEFSRSYLQQLIEAGAVQLNGSVVTKSSGKVKAGERLLVALAPTPQSQAFKAEAMALDILFQDDHLMVVNKPAGLVVHPAPGNWSGTLLNGLLAHDDKAGFLPRAGIVHRLDKDTSGLMVVARERKAMDRLVEMIAARSVSRQYIAVGHGEWTGSRTQEVDLPVGRDPRNRLRMAVVDLERHSGKTALTTITMLDSTESHCLVQCRLHTGRTHQIRVHMAALKHPLLSDAVYGGAEAGGLKRQALHAVRLAFEHPATGEAMEFRAPLPADLEAAIAAVGLGYNGRQ